MPRPDWSRKLPRALNIPSVMTLRTLSDVRSICHANTESERRGGHVSDQLAKAAKGGDVNDAVVALRLVLLLEQVPCLPL